MNMRPLSLTAFSFLLAGFISLPLALRADDMSAAPAATNTAPAPAAPAPMAQPPIVAPSATASGDTTPAAPAAPEMANPATYTVVSGDTLWDLSHKFHTSIRKIKKLNGLKTSHLKLGQVLKIPPATTSTSTTQ